MTRGVDTNSDFAGNEIVSDMKATFLVRPPWTEPNLPTSTLPWLGGSPDHNCVAVCQHGGWVYITVGTVNTTTLVIYDFVFNYYSTNTSRITNDGTVYA